MSVEEERKIRVEYQCSQTGEIAVVPLNLFDDEPPEAIDCPIHNDDVVTHQALMIRMEIADNEASKPTNG